MIMEGFGLEACQEAVGWLIGSWFSVSKPGSIVSIFITFWNFTVAVLDKYLFVVFSAHLVYLDNIIA